MSKIAIPIGGLERSALHKTSSPDVTAPRHEESADMIRPGLETPESQSFDEFVGELRQPKAGPVVAKIWPNKGGKLGIGVAGGVAVPVFQNETDGAAHQQAGEVGIES